jgi:hypothetical protein
VLGDVLGSTDARGDATPSEEAGVDEDIEERRGTRRGIWLVGLAVLVILVGGGAAVWSLLRALPTAPPVSHGAPTDTAPPSPLATFGAAGTSDRVAP